MSKPRLAGLTLVTGALFAVTVAITNHLPGSFALWIAAAIFSTLTLAAGLVTLRELLPLIRSSSLVSISFDPHQPEFNQLQAETRAQAIFLTRGGPTHTTTIRSTIRTIRVQVHNEGTPALTGLAITIARFEPPRPIWHGVPLRVRHDNPTDGRSLSRTFGLGPRGDEFIDVVDNRSTDGNASMCLAVAGIERTLRPGHYELTLRCSGPEVEPRFWDFAIDVTNDDVSMSPRHGAVLSRDVGRISL